MKVSILAVADSSRGGQQAGRVRAERCVFELGGAKAHFGPAQSGMVLRITGLTLEAAHPVYFLKDNLSTPRVREIEIASVGRLQRLVDELRTLQVCLSKASYHEPHHVTIPHCQLSTATCHCHRV